MDNNKNISNGLAEIQKIKLQLKEEASEISKLHKEEKKDCRQ